MLETRRARWTRGRIEVITDDFNATLDDFDAELEIEIGHRGVAPTLEGVLSSVYDDASVRIQHVMQCLKHPINITGCDAMLAELLLECFDGGFHTDVERSQTAIRLLSLVMRSRLSCADVSRGLSEAAIECAGRLCRLEMEALLVARVARRLVLQRPATWDELCGVGVLPYLAGQVVLDGDALTEVVLSLFVIAGRRLVFESVGGLVTSWEVVTELALTKEDQSAWLALHLLSEAAQFDFARGSALVLPALRETEFVLRVVAKFEERPFEWRSAALGLLCVFVGCDEAYERVLLDNGIAAVVGTGLAPGNDAVVLRRSLSLLGLLLRAADRREGVVSWLAALSEADVLSCLDDLCWNEDAWVSSTARMLRTAIFGPLGEEGEVR